MIFLKSNARDDKAHNQEVHIAVLTRINIVTSFILLLVFISCGLGENVDQIDPETIIYKDYAIESVTNVNGELNIETGFDNEFQQLIYKLKVVDNLGEAVENMSVVYNQVNGKSVLFLKDHFKRYNSAFIYGYPMELVEVFMAGPAEMNPVRENHEGVIEVELLVEVITLEQAQVISIPGAYYIQMYCLADSTEEGNDYTIYCREIEHIPQIIKDRIDLSFNTTSILISIVSTEYSDLIELSSHKILDESFNFGDKLITQASNQWGFRTDELIPDLIAIKSFFPAQAEHMVNVDTQFEFYQIEMENDRCEKYIVDVPEAVNNFLNTDFIDILEGKGLSVNTGLTPSNVTGNYYVDSWTNLESGTRYVNYSFQFLNQTAKYQIEVRSAAEFSDATGIQAFISGEGPFFSIYSEQDHNINDGGHNVYIKTADIYSGKLMQGGILDFQNGFIILQKKNDIYDRFLNVGDSRVVYEADYFADAVDAFPYVSVDLDPESSFRKAFFETN